MGIFLLIVALILTLVVFFGVMPKWRDGTFGNKFVQFVHDYFNFKKIYIESVLKFIFVFATIMAILGGIYLMFMPAFDDWIDFTFEGFLVSLAVIILSPIIIRLIYESTMMFILLVKNVLELNNKTKDQNKPAAPQAPAYQQAPQQQYQPYQQNDPYKY